jgi:hypothetical protein
MSGDSLDVLIDRLAAEARPVRPLGSPLARASALLGVAGLAGVVSLILFGDIEQLLARYRGREGMLTLEMSAMLATGLLAVIGAFFAAIPGRSGRWLLAPVPTFLAWLLLSGAGCYGELVRHGLPGLQIGHSGDCFVFILSVSVAVGAPLVWLLSRASPIDPVPVAVLGGLGSAALAAFLLQFFHPFAVTFIDLAVHLIAIALVVGIAAALNRRALSPA